MGGRGAAKCREWWRLRKIDAPKVPKNLEADISAEESSRTLQGFTIGFWNSWIFWERDECQIVLLLFSNLFFSNFVFSTFNLTYDLFGNLQNDF